MPTRPVLQPPAFEDVAENPEYTMLEEVANAVTHGIGALLSIAGLIALVMLAAVGGEVRDVVCLGLYGATLVLLYLVSTLYHCAPPGRIKRVLRLCDHAAIFLLIAGTYTPYTLLVLGGFWGWLLFGVVWSVAAFGVVFKVLCLHRGYARLSVALYLGLGWIGVIAVGPIIEAMDGTGVMLLAVGGLAYTGGVAFYAWRSLPYNHAVWHLFVLTGSLCHFLSIYYYVAPGGGPTV
jgi:hemolysin III